MRARLYCRASSRTGSPPELEPPELDPPESAEPLDEPPDDADPLVVFESSQPTAANASAKKAAKATDVRIPRE